MNRIKIQLILVLLVGVFVVARGYWNDSREAHSCTGQFYAGQTPSADDVHRKATQQLCFEEYALLYSGLTRTPLWSAEHLTPARVEAAKGMHRKNAFHRETRLSYGTASDLSDYAGSGYDRGHMSPSGDMATPEAQEESFSLANMVPQSPCNNEGIWAKIENSVRQMAEHGEVFVVTGPVFDSGADTRQIGNGVIVPSRIFKAVLDPDAMAAAVYVTPNADGNAWSTISLADLKALTGIDAFPAVSDDVKNFPIDLPKPSGSGHGCRLHTSERRP